MKSKISLLSLTIFSAILLAFIIKSDLEYIENEAKLESKTKEKAKENEHERESEENKKAELKYNRVTLISPEKQNQIWNNLDAVHKGKQFSDDRLMMPWAPLGPAGIRNMYSPDILHKFSGRCLMVDFDRHGNFWIGSAHGGLWAGPYIIYPVPYSENLNTLKIGAFATHPAHDSDFYVGTGLFRPFDDDPGTGLWRTKNNAATFVQQNLPDPNISWFSSVKIHRTNPNIVLAASSNGLFRTSDDGNTWNKIIVGDTTGEPSQRISDLQMDPSNPNIMYTIRNSYFLRGGMFKTTNAGLNWTALPIGVSNVGNSKISICKDFPNILYVNLTNNTGWATVGIFKSTDAGASWTVNTAANSILGSQGFNNCGITVCPNDPNTVLAGGMFMARSTDGGTVWTQISGDYVHPDITSFAWKNNNEVWSTSDGGIFKSTDKGITWTTPDNIIFVSEIFFHSISPSLEIDQAMGLEHNGVCVTHLGGSDYRMTFGGDGSGVAFHPFDTKTVYSNVGVFQGALPFRWFRSTSGGDYETWNDITSNITNPCGMWYSSVKTDKQLPVNIYTNVCGTVWRSGNEGSSWVNLNCPTAPGANIGRMITVNDNGVVFACPFDTGGVNTGKLQVFSGGVWSDRTPQGVDKTQIERVRVHPRNNNIVFALTSGINSAGKKIYRSTNLGVNWTNITGTGLDDVPMADIISHPVDPNRIYVGTQGFGFFGTTNGGANWYPWNNGMPKSVRVSEMSYIDSGFVSQRFLIYAATFGRGVYVRDLADDPSGIGNNSMTAENYSLRQNYPNPFNPMTTIEFTMKKAGVAKMDVFDINGRLISTIVDGYKQEGRQFVKFSGYELPSGVYFYRFSANGFADTKKMMIVK